MIKKMKLFSILLLFLTIPAVHASPPIANFSSDIVSGPEPLQVSFSDQSLNDPLGWTWFFGDEKYTEPWTLVNPNAEWLARKGHSSVVLPDGSIVLMGGRITGLGYTNDVWRSTDKGETWTRMTENAGWSARNAFSSVVMPDGSIVLMGGRGEGADSMNDVWRSTDKGETWTRMTESAGWSPRYDFGSVVMPDGSIVLMGGLESSGPLNDVWRSADNGETWTRMTESAGWSARDAFGSVVMPDGSIVLLGGSSLDSQNNDVWRSGDGGATWTQVSIYAGWEARQFPSSVVMPDGSIVLMGGWAGRSPMNDVWRSVDNGSTWAQVVSKAEWRARERHSSVVMPDGSIMLMGGDEGDTNTNDVWRFNAAGSSLQNPTHTYTEPGTYQVTLQAYNMDGFSSTRMAGYIIVTEGNSSVVTEDDTVMNHVMKFIHNILRRK